MLHLLQLILFANLHVRNHFQHELSEFPFLRNLQGEMLQLTLGIQAHKSLCSLPILNHHT